MVGRKYFNIESSAQGSQFKRMVETSILYRVSGFAGAVQGGKGEVALSLSLSHSHLPGSRQH